jgi:DNA repair exonuclease SbcCD ATPase subunit
LKAAQDSAEKFAEKKWCVHCEELEARVKKLETQLSVAQETPEKLAKRKSVQIEELEEECAQMEEEDKDLQKVQENNERTLKALQRQLRASEGLAITFTVKPVKAKKGKKAPKEQDTE